MNKKLLPWIRRWLPKLKLVTVGVGAMALAACATAPTTSTTANSATVNYQNTCADYVGLDQGVFALAKAAVMTYPQILQMGAVDKNISPLCAPGVNPSSANLPKITAAIATLTAIEAAHGVKP
jgi:hypothetical protein